MRYKYEVQQYHSGTNLRPVFRRETNTTDGHLSKQARYAVLRCHGNPNPVARWTEALRTK